MNARVARVVAGEPLFDFIAADGVAHAVWRAEAADRDALVEAFARIPELYIADGHHRAASAWRTRAEIAAGHSPHDPSPNAGSAENFLAVAFPDDQVQVLPYHRLVKDLHGKSAANLLTELRAKFEFVAGPPQPVPQGPRRPLPWRKLADVRTSFLYWSFSSGEPRLQRPPGKAC